MISPRIVRSVLVVSQNKQMHSFLTDLLPPGDYYPISYSQSTGEAMRMLSANDYDIVVINTPLADEFGTAFAIVCADKNIGTLLLCRTENFDHISDKLQSYGVLTLPKPVTKQMVYVAIRLINATTARLDKIEKKNKTLQERMADIRIVNHAKWLLIENLGMTEKDAHYYIEKQSMDTRSSRREIAERIIRTYDK